MELIDDCYGAYEVSPSLAAAQSDPMAQMEADFAAGLSDTDPQGRITSLQRLSDLRMAISQPALRPFLHSGTTAERVWAAYAALRCGDITILPAVRELLEDQDLGLPGPSLGNALSQVRDPAAIEGLVGIVCHPVATKSRMSAITALGKIKGATAALPAIAAHLTDNDPEIRQVALSAMARITGEPACATHAGLCLEWWNSAGRQ
jgi:HEAT repeat protein